MALGAKQPATIERSANLYALRRAEAIDQCSGAFAADRHLSSVGRQPKRSAAIALGDGNQRRITASCRKDHLMLGLPGLDDDTATTPPAADQPRRQAPGWDPC